MFLITANGLADLLSGPLLATSLDQSQRLIFDLFAFERQQIAHQLRGEAPTAWSLHAARRRESGRKGGVLTPYSPPNRSQGLESREG